MGTLIPICLLLLILLGVFLFIYSIIGFAKRKSDSHIKLPFIDTELKGPAWLVSIVIGALLVASPILLAAFQKSNNVTVPPPPASVQHVRKIEEPNYKAFRFIRDVSLLDLRAIESAPWYAQLPGWKWVEGKPRIKPGILKNYMVIKKIDTASFIHINYSTSGKLDIRCPTHLATFRQSESIVDGREIEDWEVIADVSTIPVGQEFELAVEATYWNAFAGEEGDDYTTYGHTQTEPEDISVIAFFPDDKPFKNIEMSEIAPEATTGNPIQGLAKSWRGPENKTFYWSIGSLRPSYFYKLSWTW